MFGERRRYRRLRVRFFEREHGTEFLGFEMDQMRRFAAAKKARGEIELDGYAAWARPPYFVLVPAPTAHGIHVVCRAGRGVPYPDMNGFSTVRGRMGPAVLPDGRVDHVLQADDVRGADPGFGRIEPEISHGDFVGLLFEKWRNVADTTRQLIAHTLLSSPDLTGRRTGGFTITIDALSKRTILDDLAGDLRRFVPAEARSGGPQSLRLPGLGAAGSAVSVALPGLGWGSSTAPLERIPGAVDAKLDRAPRGGAGGGEQSTRSRCSKRPTALSQSPAGACACPTIRTSWRSTSSAGRTRTTRAPRSSSFCLPQGCTGPPWAPPRLAPRRKGTAA